VRLRYRKFDAKIMTLVYDDPDYHNQLPIMDLADDRLVFPISGEAVTAEDAPIDLWQRWNDYGIALLRKGQGGELRQARTAFTRVEELGRPDGPLNLARAYIKEGLIQSEAPRALTRANEMGANQWSLLWFGATVAVGNGDYDKAITNLKEIKRGGFSQAAGRGFDFSKDYRLRNALANALFKRGLIAKGPQRKTYLEEAHDEYQATLGYDPENISAHYGLAQIYRHLNQQDKAAEHKRLHQIYKPNDNARDAVARARARYPAANKGAEAVVIYDIR